MTRLKVFIALFVPLFMVFGFQNCSGVKFDPQKLNTQKAGLEDEFGDEIPSDVPRDPQSEPEDTSSPTPLPENEQLEEVISKNAACDPLFLEASNSQDMNGKNFSFNGAQGKIAIKNAGNVNINGLTQSLSIDGSETVNINGMHQAVCVRTKRLHVINGSHGSSGVPVVIVGQDDNSSIGTINGHRGSDLVIVNMVSTSVINGTNKDIYVSGAKMTVINGNGGNLYLMHGTQVGSINGRFKNVFVYPGSGIERTNGIVNITSLH